MEVIRFPSNIQQLTVRSNLAIREELLSHPYILRDQSSAETLSMIILLVGRFAFLGCGFSASRSFFAGCHTRLLRKLAHFGAGWDGSYREIRVVPVDCPICPFLQDKIKFPLSPFPPPKIMRLLKGNQRESFFAIELDAASAERRLPICTPPVSDTRPCRAKSLEGICCTSMHKYGTARNSPRL